MSLNADRLDFTLVVRTSKATSLRPFYLQSFHITWKVYSRESTFCSPVTMQQYYPRQINSNKRTITKKKNHNLQNPLFLSSKQGSSPHGFQKRQETQRELLCLRSPFRVAHQDSEQPDGDSSIFYSILMYEIGLTTNPSRYIPSQSISIK